MLVLLPFGENLAVSAGSPWWTRFTYMWGHAGFLHYALNGIAWLMMWKILRVDRTVIAVLIASLLPSGDIPVLGWSVVLYYYIGLCVATMPNGARFRLLVLVGLSFFMPWLAAGHHAIMLLAGWLNRKVEVRWLKTLR